MVWPGLSNILPWQTFAPCSEKAGGTQHVGLSKALTTIQTGNSALLGARRQMMVVQGSSLWPVLYAGSEHIYHSLKPDSNNDF